MNRYDDRYPRYEGDRERDRDEWRSSDDWNRGEWRGDERPQREASYRGNYGFEAGEYTGRTAGGPERQPFSQNPYGYYPGQRREGGPRRQGGGGGLGREHRPHPQRYGQREPYNTSGGGAGGHGAPYDGRARWRGPWSDRGGRYDAGSRYSESQYGTSQRASGFEPRFGDEPEFGEGPFADTSEAPGFFGVGNYGDGGTGFTGGFDQRFRSRNYGSLGEDTFRSSGRESPRYRPGPKGYTRSDERVREDICERLMMAESIDSSEVSLTVASGKVTLEGTVPNRYMKHSIEDLVDSAPGVQDIDNRIRVERAETMRSYGGERGSSSSSQGLPASGSGQSASGTGFTGKTTKQ